MVLFDELQASRNEKIDLIRMALSNYAAPYKVTGSDAVTLNNLSDFISNNILYKKRKDYDENDLSSMMYKYAYRYFTQFVTPSATLDLVEMMIMYNKYMVFNVGENAMKNIFGISEKFRYSVTLNDDPLNINQDSSKTYGFSIPYVANQYKDNLDVTFRLNDSQFNVDGKIINIDKSPEGFIISSDFELRVVDGLNAPIYYNLVSSGLKVATVRLSLYEPREYIIDRYASNLIDNMFSDFSEIINSLYISESTEAWLITNGVITETTTGGITTSDKDIVLTNKKYKLVADLERLKTDGILKDIIVNTIAKYSQELTVAYSNPVTGITLDVSRLTQDIAKHIHKEINHTGIGIDELYIIFKNSTNSYEAVVGSDREEKVSTNITIFEDFMEELFRWQSDIDTTTHLTDLLVDTSKYFIINTNNNNDDSTNFVTYKNTINETIIMHLYTFIYKYFILMDVKTLDWNSSSEKDRAINTYEINQISESRPINYINVVHRINNQIIGKLESMIDLLKINNNNIPLITSGDRMISVTFQYKELNKDVYDLFMQDQVETYVANWLTKSGSKSSLFNSIYINNFNESVWELATNTNILLYTLNRVNDPSYFIKVKKLIGNPINFREKDYMDIVGYFFNSYDDVYYGMNSEHKQEIALFLRSFQDVREYYFKNILLKSLVNSDEYPLYEFILIVTMALDRYFSLKVSHHKSLDSYSSEDIDNFLDSFGLNELNRYDNFYGSFDYKMAVIRNYNNLIKNKGTRRVKKLIEDMLNDSNSEYEIKINEYYIAKSTKESINYVTSWFYGGSIYTWNEAVGETPGHWSSDLIDIVYTHEGAWNENETYSWYDTETNIKHTYTYNATDETLTTTEELINVYSEVPTATPQTIGAIQYNADKDETLFISVPEGTNRPITTIRNKVDSNATVDYETFTTNDLYWSKDITQKFINDADEGLNLNISKTKYLSISASINMEVVKIMNMYIMSILDNITNKMDFELNVESYTDNYLTINNINYSDLIKYIKFITNHLGDILDPWEPISSDVLTGIEYYGVPDISEFPGRLANFETELKKIINSVSDTEIDEFMKDNISGTLLGDQTSIISMNRYAYETNKTNIKKVSGIDAYMTSRLDGTLQAGKLENSFTDKLRKLLLGFGYSSVDFQNSAIFIIDLLESTNLLSIMEEVNTPEFSYTKAKYLKLLSMNNISSQAINISNLYTVNLKSLLQMLKDYTENKIYRENYTLKDSSVTNTLAINNAFVKILELVITTFFERSTSVYKVDHLETILTEEVHDNGNTNFSDLPEFMQDFIELLRQETISETEKAENLPKYNSILNSLNAILTFMSSSVEYELLNTVNTVNKNFSDAEYLNFLISLLSFFMSYKVTLYEESHQLDLSNPRETFIFAEDLLIWSELKLEEDWFFDEEILEIEVE